MNENLLKLIIVLPILGAALIGITGFLSEGFRKAESLIGGIATLMVAIPFGIITATFLNFHHEHAVHFHLFEWMKVGGLDVSFSYTLDELSLVMGMIITGVGSLIHIYSASYMHGDRGFYKYFLYLNLFIFAMLNLVLGDNLVVMFLGWEGVGACSYFLIGYWYEDMKKAMAAQKAFVANRIGDFAMICAMFLIWSNVHSLKFDDILSHNWSTESGDVSLIALLIFIAATGKSAQIPLYVWLPDAMAGPTPVSALIHAATMVTSGIYLIARLSEVFLLAPGVMVFVSVIGAFTAILAALIAIGQNDIKKVLAYSTVSQLGFMFMALGAGAFTTGIFHVMTHAFFKACLFLGSGSVIHAMEHTHSVSDPQDIRTMGNLRKYMPHTHMTFFISTLAIAGIPGLSGFFSKDEILGKVFANGFEQPMYFFVFAIGITTALLTAFYMTRVYFLTFRGKERFHIPAAKGDHGHHHSADAHGHNDDHGHGHDDHGHHHGPSAPHENPAAMTGPLWVLAILAIVGGFVGIPAVIGHGHFHFFNHWLEGAVNLEHVEDMVHHHVPMALEWVLILLSIAIAFGGVMLSWNLYTKHDLAGDMKVKKFFGKMYTWIQNKFYVDEMYELVFIKPFMKIGEDVILWFDVNVIDGAVNGSGKLVVFIGDGLKRLQTGFVSHYALMVVAGAVSILTWLLFF